MRPDPHIALLRPAPRPKVDGLETCRAVVYVRAGVAPCGRVRGRYTFKTVAASVAVFVAAKSLQSQEDTAVRYTATANLQIASHMRARTHAHTRGNAPLRRSGVAALSLSQSIQRDREDYCATSSATAINASVAAVAVYHRDARSDALRRASAGLDRSRRVQPPLSRPMSSDKSLKSIKYSGFTA